MSEKKEYQLKVLIDKNDESELAQALLENEDNPASTKISMSLFAAKSPSGASIWANDFICYDQVFTLAANKDCSKIVLKSGNEVYRSDFKEITVKGKDGDYQAEVANAGKFSVFKNKSDFDGCPYFFSVSINNYEEKKVEVEFEEPSVF